MIALILGLVIFLGMHSLRIYGYDWSVRQRLKMGPGRWKGLFSLISIIGFVLLVWGYGEARQNPVWLWVPPIWTRHIAGLLVLIAFIVLAATYIPGTVLKSKIGHPMLAATKTWALAHLISNGTVADVVLFGSFLIWAIVLFAVSRRQDRAKAITYPSAGYGRDVIAVIVGMLFFALFAFFFHELLIGVRPFG